MSFDSHDYVNKDITTTSHHEERIVWDAYHEYSRNPHTKIGGLVHRETVSIHTNDHDVCSND